MKLYGIAAFLSLPLMLAGCGLIYTNVRVPRAYRSATPSEVKNLPTDPSLTGKACNQSVLFLFAWGNGGYAAAVENALKSEPDRILYDVKSDMQAFSILGLYTKTCTIVSGKAAKP